MTDAKRSYFIAWREDFRGCSGWFTEMAARKNIERIQKMASEDEDGEPWVYYVIKGEDVSEDFGVNS